MSKYSVLRSVALAMLAAAYVSLSAVYAAHSEQFLSTVYAVAAAALLLELAVLLGLFDDEEEATE